MRMMNNEYRKNDGILMVIMVNEDRPSMVIEGGGTMRKWQTGRQQVGNGSHQVAGRDRQNNYREGR